MPPASSRLLAQFQPRKGILNRQYAALIELQKAYDGVRRDRLLEVLAGRCRIKDDRTLALV